MSNPFRRQAQLPPLTLPPNEPPHAAYGSEGPTDTDKKLSKGKRVRIETPPPLSPEPAAPLTPLAEDPIHRVAQEAHTGSPPPLLTGNGTASPGKEPNPFDRGFENPTNDQDEEVAENTRMNSASASSTPAIPNTGIPSNPFQRTLANMEPPAPAVHSTIESTTKPDRHTMDVDSFTRMLMTGDTGPSRTTDQSSIEPSPVAPQSHSTHRASAVSLESASSTTSHDAPSQSIDAPSRRKPPPPRHHHGKSVLQRTPQTVTFDDFAAAGDAAAPSSSSSYSLSSKASDKAPPKPSLPGTPSGVETDGFSGRSKVARAPPPPPARRSANRSSVYDGFDAVSLASDQTSPHEVEAPGARRAMASVPASSSRSSSQSGRPSMPPPPPPPPPRRRASSKSSLEMPRSARSGHDSRRSSGESTSRAFARLNEEVRSNPDAPSNVLADLSALQAEIDELRTHRSS